MTRASVTLGSLSCIFFLACSGGASHESAADLGHDLAEQGDMAGYPPWNASHPAICGQAPYTWLPASQVGAVLAGSKQLSLDTIELDILSAAAFLDGQLDVHHAMSDNVQNAVIRYQTQDQGQLTDATSMVAWPTSGGKEFPVVLFLHPTLGYTDGCAPSLSAGDLTAPMTVLSLLTAGAGYIAVFPDYLDEKSSGTPSTRVNPYLLMEPTALATLDAVRAARSYLSQQGITATGDVYLWGHSQGGQGAEFVDALQPLYAPEFTLQAVAAISPPSDLLASAKANFAGPTPNYDLGEAVAYAWYDYYGGVSLQSALLPPWNTTALTELENFCKSGYMDPIDSVTNPATVFASGFLDLMTQGVPDQPWSCWMYYNNPATMGPALNPAVPLLYVTGASDTTVFPAANLPVFDKWCGQGIKTQYLQCSGADHMQTLPDSIDNVLSFFDARRQGQALPAGLCQTSPATRCASTP